MEGRTRYSLKAFSISLTGATKGGGLGVDEIGICMSATLALSIWARMVGIE